MLLFRSEEEIDRWCAARGLERGGVVPVAVLSRLAAEWYGGRLDTGWRPRTVEASQALLASHGLEGEFWRLA